MDPKEILAKRAQVWAQMREVIEAAKAESRGMDAEERQKYERMEADLNDLTAQYDLAVRDADTARKLADVRSAGIEVPAPTGAPAGEDTRSDDEKYASAFRSFIADGIGSLRGEDRQMLEARALDLRAAGVATGGAGGYTVPQDFWAKITDTQKAFGGMLDVSNIIDTDSGADLPWPGTDDTGNVGAILAENTQITEQDVTFTTKTLKAYVYTSKLVRVSYQLLQDSAFDVEGFLGRKFGERLGRIHNTHFTTGTGTGQPQGIVTGSTVGKTAASATAINWKEFVDLIHSVDVAYRSSGRARFMMNDLVLAYARKLEDSQGRPLWQPSVQVGAPDTLLGYPITINNDMASALAVNAVSALFGDFNQAYVVRRVKGIQTVRLSERYADFLQVGFFAYDRMDGMVDDAAAVKQLKQAAV